MGQRLGACPAAADHSIDMMSESEVCVMNAGPPPPHLALRRDADASDPAAMCVDASTPAEGAANAADCPQPAAPTARRPLSATEPPARAAVPSALFASPNRSLPRLPLLLEMVCGPPSSPLRVALPRRREGLALPPPPWSASRGGSYIPPSSRRYRPSPWAAAGRRRPRGWRLRPPGAPRRQRVARAQVTRRVRPIPVAVSRACARARVACRSRRRAWGGARVGCVAQARFA